MPEPATSVRPSAIAGRWYPGSKATLRRDVERYLDAAPPRTSTGRILGLIAPHAGYSYSGPTAARAFAQVRGGDFSRVVLLGPLHRPIWGARVLAVHGPGRKRLPHAAWATLGWIMSFLGLVGEKVALARSRATKSIRSKSSCPSSR